MEEKFMRLAIEEAKKSYAMDEIPVGCIIVKDGEVIGRGHNSVERDKNALMHAEIIAIEEASETIGAWRLLGCKMYVTLEPCAMCAGAIINSRIEKLYIGAYDEKRGCCGSLINLVDDTSFNHRVLLKTEVLLDECKTLLSDFFKQLRRSKNEDSSHR